MHNNPKCNGIPIADCKNYRIGDCNFCIENGIIYVIKEDRSKIPLSIDKLLGQGVNGVVYLFKSGDGKHELAVKVTKDGKEKDAEKEIDASKYLAMLPDEKKKHIVPSIFTKKSIKGLKDGIKMIMPRFFSLSDKAKKMSISIDSESRKINKILEIFVKLCEITQILNYGLTYNDLKLENFLIDEYEKVYFGDIGSFESGVGNLRNKPHQIFEDFCQIVFNGQTYYRDFNLVNKLYLSDPVRQIVEYVSTEKLSFCDINEQRLSQFIDKFNTDPLIQDALSSLSEEDKAYLEEYALQVNKPNVGLRIYMEVKRIIIEVNEWIEENIYTRGRKKLSDLNILKDKQPNKDFFYPIEDLIYFIDQYLIYHERVDDLVIEFNKLHNILMILNNELNLNKIFDDIVQPKNYFGISDYNGFKKLAELWEKKNENKLREMYPDKTREEQLEQLKLDILALLPIERANLQDIILNCNQDEFVGGDFNVYKSKSVHQIKYTKN